MAACKPAAAAAQADGQEETQAPHVEGAGERQAVWIVTRMEAIQGDADMTLDARDLLANMSSGAQKYLAYLLREGPQSHAAACRFFNAKVTAVEKAAAGVVETLKQIVDDDG